MSLQPLVFLSTPQSMPRRLHTTYVMMSRADGGQLPPPPPPPPVEFDVDPELADNEGWEAAAQGAAIEAFVGDEFVTLERQT
jgi:hypothetical protein